VCEMAQRCGILTPASGISKLTAEILAIKVLSDEEVRLCGRSIPNQAHAIIGTRRARRNFLCRRR